MPGGDRTGPMGMGPMSGRGAGFCAGWGMPGFLNRAVAGGWFGRRVAGRGRGGGRGWRNWFYATGLTGWQRAAMGWTGAVPSKEHELAMLKQQAENLAAALDEVRRRIDAIQAREPQQEPEQT